ncbi:ribose-phosphate pyrophosphokinase [Porphyrobacter sp. AAP82]|uniref:ribose-phosphate pyrophosphokinase n=1 Tax=Porphyrobacter sp. AAP82 TaxID=1248917 RepID=UPI0002F38005|nr:ribose-phosphate pyrophosphokinase [Porphyrobacter sp. AAP82]
MLLEAARTGNMLTYKEVIERLGFDFNTNLVGQLGRVLDRIDEHCRANVEPLLAVLVVRQSDELPGQGWWVTRAKAAGYQGEWTGPDALAHVKAQQQLAFDYWKNR